MFYLRIFPFVFVKPFTIFARALVHVDWMDFLRLQRRIRTIKFFGKEKMSVLSFYFLSVQAANFFNKYSIVVTAPISVKKL